MAIRRGAKRRPTAATARPAGVPTLESLLHRARRAAFSGDAGAAIPLYVEAISKGCMSPAAFNDLGALLAQQGQVAAAVVQFEMALSLDTGAMDVRKNLCNALDAMGMDAFANHRWADAAAAYGRLVSIDGTSAVSHTNAGMAWRRARSPQRALPYLERAVELGPRSAAAHFNLGSVRLELNQPECEASFRKAIELDPGHVDAHVNLAVVCNRLGQLSGAASLARQALALAPDHVEAHANMAGILREQGEIAASLDHYRRALVLRPDSPRIFSNYLLARQGDPEAAPSDVLADHQQWSSRFAAGIDPGEPAAHRRHIDRDPERRLRIGYVSADLRNHAVASFIEPILAARHRGQIHVTCYSDAIPDSVTSRIQTVARPDVWRDVRALTDEDLAHRIAEDQIDVLVDLGGHTADHRLLAFARRPAPVQVTYCGYPGTTGMEAMGWRFTDAVADPPPAADRLHSERLWRLPEGFLCFQPHPDFGPPGNAPFRDRGFVTFGSFNNLSKLGPGVLQLWARLLRSVSGSHLLLKSRALSDLEPRERLRRMFLQQGIAADRIEFAPYAASSVEHAACYRRVDVALDPFPYNGTTTTCEALWMGVPVVTLAGAAHAGRVGASLLDRVGCPELVADTADAYLKVASGLAEAPHRLDGYRAELRTRMAASPLTNPGAIAGAIEAAYRQMWRLWCAASPPTPAAS